MFSLPTVKLVCACKVVVDVVVAVDVSLARHVIVYEVASLEVLDIFYFVTFIVRQALVCRPSLNPALLGLAQRN